VEPNASLSDDGPVSMSAVAARPQLDPANASGLDTMRCQAHRTIEVNASHLWLDFYAEEIMRLILDAAGP
jgi:hypothetical protein